MKKYYTISEVAEILGKSTETLRIWDREGKLSAVREPMSNYRVYRKDQLSIFPEFNIDSAKPTHNMVLPDDKYQVLELFAGAGGLAIGLEQAGLKYLALNGLVKR